MMHRLLALTVMLGLCGPLAAQPAPKSNSMPGPLPSHIGIQPAGDVDPAKLFAERMNQFKLKADLGGLLGQVNGGRGGFDLSRLKKMLEENPQLREQAIEKLKGIDFSSPQFAGMIEEIIRRNNWQIDPELVRRELQKLQSGSGEGTAEALAVPKPRREESNRSSGSITTEKDTESMRRAWARDIVDWASRFPKDRLAAPLRDSPAMKKLMEELAGAAAGNRPGAVGLDVQLARWQQRWESLKEWLPNDIPDLDLSTLRAPDVHLPSIDLGGSGPARSAAPFLGTIADLLPVLYVAIGVLIVIGVLRMLRTMRPSVSSVGATLGPWPVSPDHIGSRGQLISAFDYLAQLRCGPNAKAWHHRAIAERLPREHADKVAARELSALYEWARYSPEIGEPPAPVLADARRHLAQLAGGSA
jgi:hypothetical protein